MAAFLLHGRLQGTRMGGWEADSRHRCCRSGGARRAFEGLAAPTFRRIFSEGLSAVRWWASPPRGLSVRGGSGLGKPLLVGLCEDRVRRWDLRARRRRHRVLRLPRFERQRLHDERDAGVDRRTESPDVVLPGVDISAMTRGSATSGAGL